MSTEKNNPSDQPKLVALPDEVYCPACGSINKAVGPSTEFAAFVGCGSCKRLVKIILADGDVVVEVLKAVIT